MKSDNSTVLIIGYQRPEAIRQILEICRTAKVSKIYFSIDAPKLNSSTSSANLEEIKSVISEHAPFFDKIYERFLPENVGCAANLLSACDWVFANEDFVIIFEDDCIPSLDFFEFIDSVKDAFDKDSRTMLICGTQFVPVDNLVSNAIKSKYSLTWGWATKRDKWNEIRRAIRYAERETRLNIFSLNYEGIYWQEGSRRAALGYVDVWDTILVRYLVENNLYAILPQENLIQNIGNDSVAVHVEPESPWTQSPVGHFTPNKIGAVEVSEKAEKWLRDNFYIIRRRHLVSTRITRFCDKMKGPNLKSLNSRWDRASEF